MKQVALRSIEMNIQKNRNNKTKASGVQSKKRSKTRGRRIPKNKEKYY
jgi:hypothetical protein